MRASMLTEKLGNLAQLNLGHLVDILKQDRYQGVGKKFTRSGWNNPGNTSKIIDAGVMKGGIKGLRKAYRTHSEEGNLVAFAVYLNNKAVAFGLYDDHALAGKTREGSLAYDLSAFKAEIDAAYEKEIEGTSTWRRPAKMEPTSDYEKTDRHYPGGFGNGSVEVVRKFAGRVESTGELATLLSKIDQIAEMTDNTVTLKLVTSDSEGAERGRQRRMNAPTPFDAREAAKDLQVRLMRFKNAKRPTANTIHKFLEMATSKAASVVNFGGVAWKTKADSGFGGNIDPVALMNGKPFVIEYKTAEPNSYNSLKISYRYDKRDNTIRPWQAQWNDDDSKPKTVVLDPEYWVQTKLKVPNLEKSTVIKQMLTIIKDNPTDSAFKTLEKSIQAIRHLGNDWPEFAVIEKSIAAERAK